MQDAIFFAVNRLAVSEIQVNSQLQHKSAVTKNNSVFALHYRYEKKKNNK